MACVCLTVPCVPFAARAAAGADRVHYDIKKSDGRVSEIHIHIPAQKRILILDRFVDDEVFVKAEQIAFRRAASEDLTCQALATNGACEQSCYWASKARPFARVRAKNLRGQLIWQWQARPHAERLRLLSAPLNSDAKADVTVGECLSPDAKYIAAASYQIDVAGEKENSTAGALTGYAIIKVAHPFSPASVRGKKSGETFGHKRFTGFAGWKKSAPHTVLFEVMRPESGNVTLIDEGVPDR